MTTSIRGPFQAALLATVFALSLSPDANAQDSCSGQPDFTFCDDGDPATPEPSHCLGGACLNFCAGVHCVGSTACTTNSCNPLTGGCEFSPNPDFASCDDGDPVTPEPSLCFGGSCVNLCQGVTCTYPTSSCDPMTGACVLPAPDPMVVTRATAWSNGSKLGRVTYEGVVPSLDVLGGLTFNATDALSLNQSGSVSASDCTTKNSGKIYCVSKDPVVKKKVTAVFKPTATPGAFSFKVTMNKLEVPRPQAGPLAFEINEGAGATYQGSNANCAANVKKLVCKN